MLLCRDGSYYIGVTNNVEARVVQHQLGLKEDCYTFERRPVKLVFASDYLPPDQAIRLEKKIKGWSHAKKHALIRGDWDAIKRLARSSSRRAPFST
jgi:putative endonuclease